MTTTRLGRIRTSVALTMRNRVPGLLDGGHRSLHTGRSLEFHDLRAYVRGDDVAMIDWKASARHGDLLVQRQVAERRTTLMLVVASGRSMGAMASADVTKADLVLDAAATLGVMATAHGDRVGLLHWSDGVRAHRPSVREVAVEQMLRGLEASCRPDAPEADLAHLLGAASASMRGRGVVAVICSDIDIDADLGQRLRRLAARHDVLVISVGDLDPTDPALVDRRVVGLDDRRVLPLELRFDAELREQVHADRRARAGRRAAALAALSIRHCDLTAESAVVPTVIALAGRRAHV